MPKPAAAFPEETRALVRRACGGDGAAFGRLIAQHQAKVYTFAFAFAGDREEAKDLAQEAFVKVYRALPGFRFQSAFTTWLYSIVKNVFLDHRKSRAERRRALEQPLAAEDIACLRECATAEDHLLEKEERRRLFAALRRVDAPFRIVVVLSDLQGMSYEEVAETLGLPLGTVKSRLARGRAALREVLFRAREES